MLCETAINKYRYWINLYGSDTASDTTWAIAHVAYNARAHHDCTHGVIDPLYHSRHSCRDKRYECDRRDDTGNVGPFFLGVLPSSPAPAVMTDCYVQLQQQQSHGRWRSALLVAICHWDRRWRCIRQWPVHRWRGVYVVCCTTRAICSTLGADTFNTLSVHVSSLAQGG